MYKIIQASIDIAGIQQKSFIQHHPVYPLAKEWELSYPEQADINMMDILYPACFFRISSIFRKRIENVQEYIDSNTHIWSHSDFCATSNQVFPMVDKIVYIIRDPRDVVLSKADFAFTPYMKKHYPTWHSSPAEYLEAESENIAGAWKSHVEGYLEQAGRHNIMILFYERLKQDFEQELILLLDYLGFSFSENERNRIARKTSTNRMRKESPQHVRKASHYKWIENMPAEITARITAVTKPVLKELGYPLDREKTHLPEWNHRESAGSV